MIHYDGLAFFVGWLHAGLDAGHPPTTGGIRKLLIGIHVESPINGGSENNPRFDVVTSIR